MKLVENASTQDVLIEKKLLSDRVGIFRNFRGHPILYGSRNEPKLSSSYFRT
jgi:hypothetical protein